MDKLKIIICSSCICSLTLHFGFLTASEATETFTQTNPLCQASHDIIKHIASFLPYKDVKTMASTCRFLHETATIVNMPITIMCDSCNSSRVPKDLQKNPKKILSLVFFCIKSIVTRQGCNLISLRLGDLNLGSDMASLKQFLANCSSPEIAPFIVELDMGGNYIPYIPEEITGLTGLKFLKLSGNLLTTPNQICALSQLDNLVSLDLNCNKLEGLDDNFSRFKALESLDLHVNNLQSRDLLFIVHIKTLKKLNIGTNKLLPYNLELFAELPQLKDLYTWGNRDLDIPDQMQLFLHVMRKRNISVPLAAYVDLDAWTDFARQHREFEYACDL